MGFLSCGVGIFQCGLLPSLISSPYLKGHSASLGYGFCLVVLGFFIVDCYPHCSVLLVWRATQPVWNKVSVLWCLDFSLQIVIHDTICVFSRYQQWCMSLAMTASPKPPFRISWRVGDTGVSRRNAEQPQKVDNPDHARTHYGFQ